MWDRICLVIDMSASERTKQLFANKIIELSKTKKISSIQVKDLCDACNIDRTTFYYHFRDKYDLVAWIFTSYYQDERKRYAINSEEMIEAMGKRMYQNRRFFINALEDHTQNNLREYILEFYIQDETKVLCEYLGCEELDMDLDYTIRQYSYGCMGMTIEWLLGKKNYTPKQFAYYQYKFMPDVLKEAYLSKANHKK